MRQAAHWADATFGRLVDAFREAADTAQAEAMSNYMRGQFTFFGLRSPVRRQIQRRVFSAEGRPDRADVLAFARRAWDDDRRELQYAAADVLRSHAHTLGVADLAALRTLITTRSWWDTVDELAKVVGQVVADHPEARAEMDAWLDDDNLWLARTAILHQERWGEATDAAWLFAACRTRCGDRDFFIRKAIGWALRSYAAVRPDDVQAFLDTMGDALSGLSRREAARGIARARTAPGSSRR